MTRAPAYAAPLMLAAFGIGLTLGTLALYAVATPHLWSIAVAAVGEDDGLGALL